MTIRTRKDDTGPRCFLIAETALLSRNIDKMLDHLNVPNWDTDTNNSADRLAEMMGRLCYKSFSTELNPNLTRIREGNKEYIGNVIKQAHGSVFEHASTSWVFCDVSRIFTHELVRHRAGTAFSQESQRFVRLDDFSIYIPDLTPAIQQLASQRLGDDDIKAKEEFVAHMSERFFDIVAHLVETSKSGLKELIGELGLDEKRVTFHVKKQLTSALRRFVPGGVNTNIGFTANHRAMRYTIHQRTAPGAEIEIAEVFNDVAPEMKFRYPATYQDMIPEPWNDGSGLAHFKFETHKI